MGPANLFFFFFVKCPLTLLITFQNALGALSQILISLRQHATFRDVVNTIEEFDGLSCIQLLQQHESADISLLAFEINESVFFHENYVRLNRKF